MADGVEMRAVVRPRESIPREIWVLAGAAFIIAIGYGLVAPALPTFARSFDVGVAAASFVVSAFAVFRLAFAPVSGRLVGRFGELPTYLVGLVIVALSTGACAFATSYGQLVLFRSLGGIGSTMFTVSSLSLLVRLAPESSRGRASSLWATGFLMGNITGPLVGGGLAAISLRAPFVVYAVMLLVAALLTGVLLRGRTGAPTGSGGAPVVTMTLATAFGHRAYRAALAANFTNGWTAFGVRVALVPLFVVEVLGQDESWAGIALGVFAAGTAIAIVAAGRLTDRIGRRPPILVGLAVSALGTAVIGLIDNLPLFLAVSLFAGLGSGLLNPPVNAAVADVIGRRTRGGTVLAGFQMSADIGLILGPVVAGVLAQFIGYGAAFGLTGAVAAVAFAFWVRAPETLPARAPEDATPADAYGPVADCTGCDGPPQGPRAS